MELILAFWGVLAKMSPWLIGGFLLSGIVSILLPRDWVVKAMGRSKGWRGVINAVLIGVPLPICSCGVLPLTAALRKAGAGKGAVAGFLISTPQTGVDSILATYALMGPLYAVARPLAAFATGIAGGISIDLMGGKDGTDKPVNHKGHCCPCCHSDEAEHHECDESPKADAPLAMRILKAGFIDLFGEIVRPLVVGLAVSALVTALVPEDFFTNVLGGNDWISMPAMAILGFPMYVCSTASIPIAASFLLKGLSPGAALVFLMVGPAINAASVASVSKLIGLRATCVYTSVILLGAIAAGIIMNMLPAATMNSLASCCAIDEVSLLEHIAGTTLVILIAANLIKEFRFAKHK